MDLRNRTSHLHYIHVVKKGTVIELMNQSPSGVPARKFRDINDIYDDDDSLRDISLGVRNLKKKSSASVTGCSEAGMRILICSPGASLWNDPFSEEAAGNTSPDDSSSYELTLQQWKEKCTKKGKKRKAPESDFGDETSPAGKEYSEPQPNDDLSDLMLPLRYLMSNLRKKRRANVVENPDLVSQSQNTVLDFDNSEEATFDKYRWQQIESTTEHSNLASTVLQPSSSHDEDDNSGCCLSSLDLQNWDSTSGDLPSETANCSYGSQMMHEEHTGNKVHNQESSCGHSDRSTTYPQGVPTKHKETGMQDCPEEACRSLQQGFLYHQPVSKVSSLEDVSGAPFSDVCLYARFPSLDLAPREHDKPEPQCIMNEIVSQAGNDPINYLGKMEASVEAEVIGIPDPEVVCQNTTKLSPSPMILLEIDVQERIHVTPLPDACLHAVTNSVDRISCGHGNSEPLCTVIEVNSLGVDNIVKTNYPSDRLTIKVENENSPNSGRSCQILQTGLSHLPVSEVSLQEDTSTTCLLDVPLDALTSGVDHSSDNGWDVLNDNPMAPAAQVIHGNQQIDDRLVAGPENDVNIMREYQMVKENIEVVKTSNPQGSLTTSSIHDGCQLASSNSSCYSDCTVPTNQTGRSDAVTSCSISETSTSTMTESCRSIDKPFGPESHELSRSDAPPERFFSEIKSSPPNLQKKLWKAMESIDTIDSREKLRSLGKLFSDNQNKRKKRSTVKNEIKGSGQVSKSDMSKLSDYKRSGSAHEHKLSGIKRPSFPSSLGRDKKKGLCIQSCPEGAILFSKKQMQDFEALAKKLTSELASMKDIIEGRLNHEAGSPDHNNDQVITALNKASDAEETARKQLSAMNRDCIRFCTIMKTSDDNSKDTENTRTIAHKKERRKIKFADEAGGQLCQIMFFESANVGASAAV